MSGTGEQEIKPEELEVQRTAPNAKEAAELMVSIESYYKKLHDFFLFVLFCSNRPSCHRFLICMKYLFI